MFGAASNSIRDSDVHDGYSLVLIVIRWASSGCLVDLIYSLIHVVVTMLSAILQLTCFFPLSRM